MKTIHLTPAMGNPGAFEDYRPEPYPGYNTEIQQIAEGLSQFPGALEFIEDHSLRSFLNGDYPEDTGYYRP